MTGYEFELSCPNCGAEVEHVAGATSTGHDTTAICQCTGRGCRKRWQVVVAVAYVGTEDRDTCGTLYGYQVHLRAGEEACPACKAANCTATRESNLRRRMVPV